MAKRIWDHPYTYWILLALPSFAFIAAGFQGEDLEELLHPTGEFSARLMIIAMMLTPLRMLFPKTRWLSWLMSRRRYLGVAAFGYALLHTLYYVIDLGSLSAVMADIVKIGIWTGWIAFVIFVPLFLTSNDFAVRAMGPGWKMLQRWVYVAAVATALHWIFVHNELGPALVHFVPLAGLEMYRIWRNWQARPAPVSL